MVEKGYKMFELTEKELERIRKMERQAEIEWAGKTVPAVEVAKMAVVHKCVVDKIRSTLPDYEEFTHMRVLAQLDSILDKAK